MQYNMSFILVLCQCSYIPFVYLITLYWIQHNSLWDYFDHR